MAQDGRGLVYGIGLGVDECKKGRLDVDDEQMERLIALSYMDEQADELQIELYIKLLHEAQRFRQQGYSSTIRRKIGRR